MANCCYLSMREGENCNVPALSVTGTSPDACLLARSMDAIRAAICGNYTT